MSGYRLLAGFVLASLSAGAIAAVPPTRLEKIAQRGYLRCGLARDMPGFSIVRSEHVASGFDVDLCRAVATNILGDPAKVRFRAIDRIEEFQADDGIDVVFHGLTRTQVRERRWNIAFAAISFHDGQAIAVRRSIHSHRRLAQGPICVERGSIFEQVLANAHPRWRLRRVRDAEAARRDLASGRCIGWSWDASSLMARLSGRDAVRYRLLPERYSYEPLAPIVRAGDRDLLAKVSDTIDALIAAQDRTVKFDAGQGRVVAVMGDYGAIYGRNLEGPQKLQADRGPNRPVSLGGRLVVDHSGIRKLR